MSESEVVRLISGSKGLMLDACDGRRTIARASDIFSRIDSDFKNWGTDVAGEATPETPVAMYEIANSANFAKIFTSLNSDVSRLVLAQGQILNFVEKYGDWLQKNGWATFFLFRTNSEFFVASAGVYVYSVNRLRVSVYRFGYDFVWYANDQRWLVVPQL